MTMTETLIVAVLSLFGTMFGSIAGIMTTNKLVNYRLDRIEEKVEKHNSVADRVLELEINMRAQWTRVDDARNAIEELKKEVA